MKFSKKESIQKLGKCRALFQNHLLATQDLWLKKIPKNSITIKPAHGLLLSFISQLISTPSRKDASSRDRGSFTALQDIRRSNAAQAI